MNKTTGIFQAQETGTWHFTFTAVVRTDSDKEYRLTMTRLSSGSTETIIARSVTVDKGNENFHYATVCMNTITHLLVGEEVAIRVDYKRSENNHIGFPGPAGMANNPGPVATFTGFMLK